MKISVVIPNYNGEEIVKKNIPKVVDALTHFRDKSKNDVELIINDDFSKDNSMNVLHTLKDTLKKKNVPIFIYQNEKNYGFSTTVNRGVRKASGDLIVLLNTDVNPDKDFLSPLVENFEDLKVFAAGCMDRSVEEEGVVLRGRGVGYWKQGFLHHKKGELDKTDTLWVSGGSAMFRKSLWDKLHGLDEIYNPFYWEDIDLSYRAQKAGYKVLFDKKSIVTHEHEKGAIKSKYKPIHVQKIAMRNQFIFTWKNITDPPLLLSHVFWLPYHLIKSIVRRDIIFLSGFGKALLLLPKIIQLRMKQHKLNQVKDTEILAQFK
jgi:GT2 family glycosyltransferase